MVGVSMVIHLSLDPLLDMDKGLEIVALKQVSVSRQHESLL